MELPSDLLVEIYRRILRIRFFEEAVVDLMESPLYPNADRVVAAVEKLLDA
jgi:hypothetical protein